MMRRRYRLVATIICVTIMVPVYIRISDTNMTPVWNITVSTLPRIHQSPEFLINKEFPINEDLFCKPMDDVLLLIAVYSGTDQGMERQFIRQKWGSYAKTNKRIRLLFFVGLPPKKMDVNIVQRESQMYRDIIQFNSTDTYRNLTLKSFAFFRWSQQYCKIAKYLLKIDCDMEIDLKRLLSVLERGNFSDSFQCGVKFTHLMPIRTLGHKWFISKETYAKKFWPPYCFGPAYIVSSRIAAKIATLRIPKDPFPVDDVYMTGILREILKEEIRLDILRFSERHYTKTNTKVMNGNIPTYIKHVEIKDKRNVNGSKTAS